VLAVVLGIQMAADWLFAVRKDRAAVAVEWLFAVQMDRAAVAV